MRPATVGQSTLDLVERHWRDCAPSGGLPRHRAFDATAVGAALPQAFTLEEVALGVARIRVAGQRLYDWFGADPRGVPLSALFDEASRPALREALGALFLRPALVEVGLVTPCGAMRSAIGGRLLLLPLQSDDGSASRAVGVIGLDAAVPAGARRFGLPDGAARRIEPVGTEVPRRVAAMGSFAQGQPLADAVRGLSEKERPWLRLVVRND